MSKQRCCPACRWFHLPASSHPPGLPRLPPCPPPPLGPSQLLVFTWRSGQIKDKAATLYDDRRGPLGLAAVIVAALSLIFFVALADFIHLLRHHGDAPPAPAPPPTAVPPAAALLGGGGGGTAAAQSWS